MGGSADDILLSDQEPGKNVYFAAYTISDDGVYTLLPEYTGSSPWYTVPYTSQWDNDLRFELPTGWTANENTGFRIEMQNRYTQGNAMQLACSVRKPNPTDGVKNWVATPTVSIPARHASVTFTYAGVLSTSRFASEPYNNWPENDVLAVQVSEDGQNWTDVAKYTATDHPAQEEMTTFNTITGDLDAYAGKQIYIRLYWDTFNSASFGSTLVLNDMKIEQGELPTVPTVTVSDVTYNSAKLSWNTEYPNYKVYYGVKGQEKTGKEVAANTLELTELEAVTEYEAYVIGVTAEGEETEASETISFTTAAWPTVEAPTDLAADDSEWASNGVVTLSWTGTEEMLTYEVRYRESTGTSYEYVQNLTETSTVLGQLEGGKTYVWAVRANCTHDRVTVWSAQGRFTLAKIVEVPEVQVADVTENSAKLTWNTEYPAYNVYYGKKGAEPTCVKVEKANELEILDLEAETEYEAYVVAVDTDGQLSEPSATVSFTTLKSGVGALKAGQIKVFALNGQLTLMSGDEMEAVEVYTAGGQQIASLKACGNQVVIPAQGAVILRVKTAQGVKTFKAVL